MTRRTASSPEENRQPRSRPGSQHGHHAHNRPTTKTHSQARSPHVSSHHNNKTAHKPAAHLHHHNHHHHSCHPHNPSPLIMVTTTSSAAQHHGDGTPYHFVPDADQQPAQVQGYGWMKPIIIDDDDLMFGGKSLSTWYEEERKSLSISVEEERRGRQRVRQPYHSYATHHHHHPHKHPHHHHPNPTKPTNGGNEQKH